MNPLKHLLPALYASLSGLEWEGAPVPVFEHLPAPLAGHYVLLHQPTATGQPGTAGCRQWSCTALVDVVTQFAAESAVSSAPADEVAEQVSARLEGKRLALPAGLDCGPAVLELHTEIREGGAAVELPAVRRLLRFRWAVFHHAAAPDVPAPAGFPYRLPLALA